jgi:uncharacterized repeat protein (TIGR01451 family)
MPACTTGPVAWLVTGRVDTACGNLDKEARGTTACSAPNIKVTKTGETLVTDGDIIHYEIKVENTGDVDLEDVVITDQMCSYTTYNDNATPAPFSEPAIGAEDGTIVWKLALLAKGATATFTFQAKASLAAGGAQCPNEVVCTNRVTAEGSCFGSGGSNKVSSSATHDTTIRCITLNCPRTPGYWAAQCAQKLNGSTKFTKAEVTQIAEKVDDVSSFFNWSAGTDFDKFCATISPPKPMDQRKQAKRQFASFLANYATDALDLTPARGGEILLDLSTPIHCDGLDADNLGELIAEVDQKLADLEGQDITSGSVKSAYGKIIGCLDAINNGVSIPTTPDCEETNGVETNRLGDNEPPSVGSIGAVELYKAVPNPFSSSSQFSYEVLADGANVDIAVFDVAGRQIKRLASGVQPSGRHTASWDGTNDAGAKVSRGVYFVRTVITGQKAPVQRLLFVRDGQ